MRRTLHNFVQHRQAAGWALSWLGTKNALLGRADGAGRMHEAHSPLLLCCSGCLQVRLGVECIRMTDRVIRGMPQLGCPFLVIHSVKDNMTDPDGSKHLYQVAKVWTGWLCGVSCVVVGGISARDVSLKVGPRSGLCATPPPWACACVCCVS